MPDKPIDLPWYPIDTYPACGVIIMDKERLNDIYGPEEVVVTLKSAEVLIHCEDGTVVHGMRESYARKSREFVDGGWFPTRSDNFSAPPDFWTYCPDRTYSRENVLKELDEDA